MSNLVTSGSRTINTNNIISLYCKSQDEKECKLMKIMDCRSKNYSKYLMTDIFAIHGPS